MINRTEALISASNCVCRVRLNTQSLLDTLGPHARETSSQSDPICCGATPPGSRCDPPTATRHRLYGPDDLAVLALKRRPRIDAGVSRVEEPLDPALALALACAADPARLGAVDSPIVRLVAAEYGVGGIAAPFVCNVYELDETPFLL